MMNRSQKLYILILTAAFLLFFNFADAAPVLPAACPGVIEGYNIVDIASSGFEFTSENDFIFAGDDNSTPIDGGNGDDCILIGNNNTADISGSNGNDFIIVGDNNAGGIQGVNGNDTIIVGNSNSGEISGDGENGDDNIKIGDNNSGDVFGDNGADTITLGENNSALLSGGNGADLIVYGYGNTGGFDEENEDEDEDGGGEDTLIAVPPAPSANPLPGTYTSIQNVVLSSVGADSIRYTTDGTTPECSTGVLYTSPISIFLTKTVTAVGCKSGYASPAASLTYTIEKLAAAPADLAFLLTASVFVPKDGTSTASTSWVTVTQNIEIKVASTSESMVILGKDLVISRVDAQALDANLLTSSEVTVGSLTGLGEGKVVEGALEWGIPNTGLQFSIPITIRIFVGTDLNGRTLNVVRSVTGTGDWTSDGIVSPATCVVSEGICAFQATRASYYATYTETPPPPPQTSNSGGGGWGGAGMGVFIDGPLSRQSFLPENSSGFADKQKQESGQKETISKPENTAPESQVSVAGETISQQEFYSISSISGVLLASDNANRGNLVLVSGDMIIYIKTSRDFNDLVGKNVVVSIDGTLDNFAFLHMMEENGSNSKYSSAKPYISTTALVTEGARVKENRPFVVSLFASVGRLILRSLPFF